MNVYRGVESIVYADKNSFEVTGELDFHKYFLTTEFGYASFNRGDSFTYTAQGNYLRLGIDQNVIPYNTDNDVITVGLRYAFSSFQDRMVLEANSLGQQVQGSVANNNLQAQWIEAVVGMKVNLWKYVTIGYQLRGKFAKRLKGQDQLETYDIPGFGRHKKGGDDIKDNAVGFDYYVYFTLPWREKHIPPKPIK